MTPNQLIEVLGNLTPEEKDLPMTIDKDLATYYTEEIRSLVVEQLSNGYRIVCVSACAVGIIRFNGDVSRTVWASN